MKSTYREIPLEEALHDNQHYLLSHPRAQEIRALRHQVPTDTCEEKASLIGWNPNRVVKALYFSNGEQTYGFILPEQGRCNPNKNLKHLLGMSGSQAARFKNGQTPLGMERGTCTPFPRSDASVDGFIVHRESYLQTRLVDVSIGGAGEQAHRTSLWLPYEIIEDVLYERFPGNVFFADVFKH